MRLECGDIPYYLEVPEGLRLKLSGLKAMLQLPDGLKQYSNIIAGCVSEYTGATVVVQGDSVFGACDLHYQELLQFNDIDAILHVGHTPYPDYLGDRVNVNPKGRVKVMFIQARFKGLPNEQTLGALLNVIRARGLTRVALATTVQYEPAYSKVLEFLRRNGVETVTFRGPAEYYEEGQVIGCDYSFVPRRVDGFVIVSSGEFHALGLYLATLKPVIQLDVTRDSVKDLTGAGERLYASRLFRVSQAMDASRWGVIVGTKTGQNRPWVVSALENVMKRRGVSYIEIYAGLLDRLTLANFDSDWYQVFVVTSCPRLPIDDFNDYQKPVLTPGEAFMALMRTLSPYRFPW